MTKPTLDAFFSGRAESRPIFQAIVSQVDPLGEVTIRVSKSQIAFRRKKNFAVVWVPGQYLKNRPAPPLVLTFSCPAPDPSPRWKEITKLGPKRFTHHLELYRPEEVDDEVVRWLRAAWERAG